MNYKPLTAKEQEVLKFLKKGKHRKLIAGELNISINTLNTHLRNLHLKTNTHSIPELILWKEKG
jgi:DNA-binding CsgD family transcriptional regulator